MPLGVRYVLEGSVRKLGNRVRITSQLIDATNAAHVGAERYDRALDDIFALQDELTMSVVGTIEPSPRQAEVERAKRKRPDSLDAYDLYLRAPFPMPPSRCRKRRIKRCLCCNRRSRSSPTTPPRMQP